MPKIIVMNASTEQMSGGDPNSNLRLLAAKTAWRSAWFANNDDIIISPVPIQSNFLNYIGNTLNFDPSTVRVITTDQLGAEFIITDELLLSPSVMKHLKLYTRYSDQWQIMPCYFTEGVAECAVQLGITDMPGQRFAAQRGCDLLNRKSHFRQLAVGAGLPLAEGSIVDTPNRLAKAIRKHLRKTGIVIVKTDNGAGGMGNITLTKQSTSPLAGSRETRKTSIDIEAMAVDLWSEMTNSWCQTLVVESYYEASHIFYLEYSILDDGSPSFLNSGTIRLKSDSNPAAKELVWLGLEIPAEVPAFSFAKVLNYGVRFVEVAANIGYRGPLNIDVIVTDTNQIIFNEVNARWGGDLSCMKLLNAYLDAIFRTHM